MGWGPPSLVCREPLQPFPIPALDAQAPDEAAQRKQGSVTDSSSPAIQRAELKRSARNGARGWKKGGNGKSYSQIIHAYFQSEQYAKLSPRAVKLLVDLTAQYRGTNNGDLTTAWSVMVRVGWKSKHLLYLAVQELEARGWIIRTRKGLRAKGHSSATLWALTFYGIDDCRDSKGNRKLDAGIKPDPMPLHFWRMTPFDTPAAEAKRRFRKKSNGPIVGPAFPDSRANVLPLSTALSRQSGQK
jgi:hypothetical protein